MMTRCTICRQSCEQAPSHIERLPAYGADIPMYDCPSCGGTFSVLPKDFPLVDWYQDSDFYLESEYAHHHADPAKDWRFGSFFKAVERHGIVGRMLDVGCGEGGFLLEARRRGWTGELRGLDVHKERVERMKDGIAISLGRLEEYAQAAPHGRYDAVTIFDTLEHFPEPADTFDALKAVMKDDAWLGISVPNAERLRFGARWEEFDYPPNHVTRWSASSLRGFLERADFEIVEMRSVCAGPASFSEPLFYYLYARAVRLAKLVLHAPAQVSPNPASATAQKASAHPSGKDDGWRGPFARREDRKKVETFLRKAFNLIGFIPFLPAALLWALLRPRSGPMLFALARRKPA